MGFNEVIIKGGLGNQLFCLLFAWPKNLRSFFQERNLNPTSTVGSVWPQKNQRRGQRRGQPWESRSGPNSTRSYFLNPGLQKTRGKAQIRAQSRNCSTVARTRTVSRYVVSKPCIVRRASFVLFPFFSDIVLSFSVLFRSLFLCLLARRILRSFGVVSRDDRVWIILAWSSHLRHYFVRKDSSLFLSSCRYSFSLNDGFSRLLFFSLLHPNPTPSLRTSTA